MLPRGLCQHVLPGMAAIVESARGVVPPAWIVLGAALKKGTVSLPIALCVRAAATRLSTTKARNKKKGLPSGGCCGRCKGWCKCRRQCGR